MESLIHFKLTTPLKVALLWLLDLMSMTPLLREQLYHKDPSRTVYLSMLTHQERSFGYASSNQG